MKSLRGRDDAKAVCSLRATDGAENDLEQPATRDKRVQTRDGA